MSKRINNQKVQKISADIHALTDEGYPRPVCLELADLSEAEGFEKEILETLKSFSSKESNRKRDIHDLVKKGKEEHFFKEVTVGKRTYKFNKVWSIDIDGRRSRFRMIYATDDLRDGVVKILSFKHDTHISK